MTLHRYDRARVLAIAQYDPILRAVVRAAARHPGRWVKHRSKKYAVRRLPGGSFELAAGVTMKQARRLAAKSAEIRKGLPKSSTTGRRSARTGRRSRKNDAPSRRLFTAREGPYELHVHRTREGFRSEIWKGKFSEWSETFSTLEEAKRRAMAMVLAMTGNPGKRGGRRNDPPPGRKAMAVMRRGVFEYHVHKRRGKYVVEKWDVAGGQPRLFKTSMPFPELRQAKMWVETMGLLGRWPKNPGKPQVAEWWDVYLRGKRIDSVSATGYDADEMKRSLVDHDGYDAAIEVRKARRKAKGRGNPCGSGRGAGSYISTAAIRSPKSMGGGVTYTASIQSGRGAGRRLHWHGGGYRTKSAAVHAAIVARKGLGTRNAPKNAPGNPKTGRL